MASTSDRYWDPSNNGLTSGAGTRNSPGSPRASGTFRYPRPNIGVGSGIGVRAPMERTGVLDAAVSRGAGAPPLRLPGASSSATLKPGSFTVESSGPARRAASPAAPPRPEISTPSGSPASGITRPGATSIAGRPLGYGENIDGVRTFSDGSGSVPRTMSDEQIAGLANGSRVTVVPAGSIGRPAPGVAHSMATGGQTPALGAVRRPEAPMFSRTVDPVRRAQIAAAHDMADIASGNMQSAAGRGASELRRRANSGDKSAATQLETMMANAGVGIEPTTRLADAQLREAGADRRTAVDAAVAVETARIQRPQLQPEAVAQADGTLALVRPDGTATTATMPDGTPVRPMPTTNTAMAKSRDAALGRVQRNLSSLMEQATLQSGGALSPEQLRDLRMQALTLEGAQFAEDDAGNMIFNIGGEWAPL
jgi:hypothetical protein